VSVLESIPPVKTKLRARTQAEKAIRKQSIVDALKYLLMHSDELPSAMQIAQQAGVTKSVIYQYFASREEIFLTLLIQLSVPLLNLTEQTFNDIKDIQKNFIAYFLENPLFMRLSIMAPVILEDNVDPAVVKTFKLSAAHVMIEMAKLIEPFCTASEESRRTFINSFYQLSLMKWRYCHPPKSVQQAFEGENFWLVSFEIESELNLAFEWLWTGLKHSNT